MFVGYSDAHDGDCYMMCNKSTNKYYQSQDVIFLNRKFFQKEKAVNKVIIELDDKIDGKENCHLIQFFNFFFVKITSCFIFIRNTFLSN